MAKLENKRIVNGVAETVICELQQGVGIGCNAHYHTYIELIYCIDGSFDVWLNNNRHSFGKGDLLVISSNEVHEIVSLTKSIGKYIVLRFEPEILYSSTKDVFGIKYVMPFMFGNISPQKVFKHEDIYQTDIPSLMFDACNEYSNREYGYEFALRADICRIFVRILRYWAEKGITVPTVPEAESLHIKALRRVLDYISEHYSEEISAESAAKLANMSYSHFSKTFGKVMNRNFNDYLNLIRITEAEKLLASTNKTVTEIAFETGFASSSYFIKIFERYKNVTPTNFRRNFIEHK